LLIVEGPIVIEDLSLDEKIGQMFVVVGRAVFMSESSWAYQELTHQVRDNHIGGVILAKTALDLPLGIWIMKGFYDTVPWEIEMAGVQDGASRFTVWRKLVLPQIKPGLMALGIFSIISGWSEYVLPQVLAPRNDVQVLSVYLAALINDDTHFDFHVFKAVGLFYALPIFVIYLFFQNKLMTIYGGGTKG